MSTTNAMKVRRAAKNERMEVMNTQTKSVERAERRAKKITGVAVYYVEIRLERCYEGILPAG
jgi:hypothetical protein